MPDRVSAGLAASAGTVTEDGTAYSGSAMQGETMVRLAVFAGALGGMALAEALRPRRRRALPRARRWPHNLGLVAAGAVAMRVVAPAGAVTAAVVAARQGWGVLPTLAVPPFVAWTSTVLVLDLAIWAQHLAMHKVDVLWRLHRVHHADVDVDVTTGVRFHPIEYLLSLGWKAVVIVALGAPAGAVVLFEVLLNATSMFNHANLRLSPRVDRMTRWLLVTPDMHRVHHSIDRQEADNNYGFNVPWWDRLFGTYRAQPQAPHETMTLGVSQFREAGEQRIDRLLTQPFR